MLDPQAGVLVKYKMRGGDAFAATPQKNGDAMFLGSNIKHKGACAVIAVPKRSLW